MAVETRPTVLIVDDEPDIVVLLSMILEQEGFRSVVCSNGTEALEVINRGERPAAVLLDLMLPFQRFDYYDPKQLGRYSIKSVYPALVGGSYEGMPISDGGQASREYARVTFSDGIAEEDKRRVYEGLLEYCKLDTLAMVDILKILRSVAGLQG